MQMRSKGRKKPNQKKQPAPLEEKRIVNSKEIIRIHCTNIKLHRKDEKKEGPHAIMSGGYTRYGQWWHTSRDPSKRPFYTYSPETVEETIRRLTVDEVKDVADLLRYISQMSVTEYQPAAQAARERLQEVGMPLPK
jgi:hypothetical protein